MPDTFATSALRRKRAHIAGEIAQLEKALAKLRRARDTIDATLNLFTPATNPDLIPPIRPYTSNLFFRNGEQMRLCLDALREACKPVRTLGVTAYVMEAKGLPSEDGKLRTAILDQVRKALYRMEKRGLVRRMMTAPETWWELAPDSRVAESPLKP